MVVVNADAALLAVREREEVLASEFLGRPVAVSVLLPPGHDAARPAPYPVLYLNDGQDLARLHLRATLAALWAQGALAPFVVVAPHANAQRLHEYGIAGRPDYNGRGNRAAAYTDFVLRELLPWAQAQYRATADPAQAVFAGFSLGGLMAFDAVWHHPEVFARAGAFSGAFWWRGRAIGDGYTPAERLMHQQVRARPVHPTHAFWLQTGTLDERNDRNENGVIDAIEDSLDLVDALRAQGLDTARQLRYVQVEGGHHHPDTWGRVLPDFLGWAFGAPAAAAALPPPLPVVRLHLDPHLAPALVLPAAAAAVPASINLPPPAHPAAGPLPVFVSLPLVAATRTTRPEAGDFAPFYETYVALVPAGHDPLAALRAQAAEVQATFGALTDAQALTAYAPGKWTPKQVLLHLADAERVFAYRALRFARADDQALAGFDENAYADTGDANARPLRELLAEYAAVRAATLVLFEGFTAAQLARRGTANGAAVTVRALLFIVPGHERHHLHVFRERYAPVLHP
ncbi:MAG: alpha/beta hydrolase-fold protein [Janthinobacterium lividum]